MKKKLILLLSLMMLCACTSTKQIQLKESVTLSFFYIETCPQCQAFKKEAIPLLETTFQDQIIINQYDLDDLKNTEKYDHIIDSLEDFDEEFYGKGPFIVVEDYFALLGYDNDTAQYLIDDIQKAVNHEELGYELEGLRFIYKEKK